MSPSGGYFGSTQPGARALPSRRSNAALLVSAAALFTAVSACTKGSDTSARTDSSSGAVTAASSTTTATTATAATGDTTGSMAGMGNMQGMNGMDGMKMTGDPNHDFLRMMSDHHKDLIAVAHEANEKGQRVKADAQRLDKIQDAELDTMVTMLADQYKDDYTPKGMPMNKSKIDSLTKLSGAAFDRGFREYVIMHHEQAVKMMDEYLPTVTDPKLKAMIPRMRADQMKEIAEFRQKLSQG